MNLPFLLRQCPADEHCSQCKYSNKNSSASQENIKYKQCYYNLMSVAADKLEDYENTLKYSNKYDDLGEEQRSVLRKAIATYGKDAQVFMAIEEMSELMKALSKEYRASASQKSRTIENIAEEIADVSIMLEQLRMIFGIDIDVLEIRTKKIKRLAQRLGDKSDMSDGSAND